jgi:hypothetical protein
VHIPAILTLGDDRGRSCPWRQVRASHLLEFKLNGHD